MSMSHHDDQTDIDRGLALSAAKLAPFLQQQYLLRWEYKRIADDATDALEDALAEGFEPFHALCRPNSSQVFVCLRRMSTVPNPEPVT